MCVCVCVCVCVYNPCKNDEITTGRECSSCFIFI